LEIEDRADDSRRNYAYYQHSITAAKALVASKPDLVRGLIDVPELDGTIGEKERAPKLARLELDLALVQHSSDMAMSETDWKEVVMDYLNKWGSKGSIVPELEAIVGKRKEWLATELESRIASGQVRLSLDLHYVRSSWFRTTRNPSERSSTITFTFSARRRPPGSRARRISSSTGNCIWMGLSTVRSLVLHTNRPADPLGKNLPRTDIQPADEIGLTAVQLVLSANSPDAPLRAILCLEYMISQSPSCTHAKYLLIRLYRLTGTYFILRLCT
jgi:N-terminal acetyltransferase B complex non-catalytic subunit